MRANEDPLAGWGRRRLIAMLLGAVGFAALVIAGLTFTVVKVATSPDQGAPATTSNGDWPIRSDGTKGEAYRDAVAAEPMLVSGRQDMQPAAPSLEQLEPVEIGPATSSGPSDVASGFEHTPEGAMGQLAAIAIRTLEPMSVQNARDILSAWSAAGVDFERWDLAQSIEAFHEAAGTVDNDPSVSVSASPVGAQIKGTDGQDWTLACVQLDVTVAVVDQTRFGFGHCERMQWAGDRWVIAAGRPPAQAPSTWPGSQRSVDAGWRPWAEAEPTE